MSSSRAISMRSSVFTGDFAWHSAARNAEKSCLPRSAAAPARIGAPRCHRARARAGDLGERALERILHSAAVGLRLPAVKRRAIVFESERDAHGAKKTAALRAAVLRISIRSGQLGQERLRFR